MDGVTAAVARCVPDARGAVGRVYDDKARTTRGRYAIHVDSLSLAGQLRRHEVSSMNRLDFLVGAGSRARSVVETVDGAYGGDVYLRAMVAGFRQAGVTDMKHVTVGDGDGLWVTVGVLTGRSAATPWTSPSAVALASHLGAELRRVRTMEDLATRYADASGRGALRAALERRALSSTDARSNEAVATWIWEGVLRGEWMVLDRFRSGGRTLLLVRGAPEGWRSPHALTPGEAQVAAYASTGVSNKWIADRTETSLSTVSTLLRRAIDALGLPRRADLPRQFALGRTSPADRAMEGTRAWLPLVPVPRAGLRATPIEGDVLLVSYASGAPRQRAEGSASLTLGDLPPGRRRVVELVLEGLSDAAIAERMGVSRHTISNQLRRAYRTLDVGSRFELVARVFGEADACGDRAAERGAGEE